MIVAKNVFKTIGDPGVTVLSDINLEINDGEFVALTGRSGSGKSTLLYLLSSLDKTTRGSIEVSHKDLALLKPEEINKFRNQEMGFVFQFHYLLAELSALENVLLPVRRVGKEVDRENYAKELLVKFGLEDKFDRLPRQLSGGEQQRVAIARALVMKPKYLFADEPTGNLDSVNGEIVLNIIEETNKNDGTTVIMVTHDESFAKRAKRRVHLKDGKIES